MMISIIIITYIIAGICFASFFSSIYFRSHPSHPTVWDCGAYAELGGFFLGITFAWLPIGGALLFIYVISGIVIGVGALLGYILKTILRIE